MQYLTNIDLNKNELQNARLQNLTVVPSGPLAGQFYFNATSKTFMGWNGTTWIDMSVVFSNKNILDAITAAFTSELKTKLDGIAPSANNYSHPTNHPATIITQDANYRFVTDVQIAAWNGKETTTGAQSKATAAQTAAQTYTDTKIAALLDSAPGVLDTLNELAAALGDNPNFATDITNMIALKPNKYAGNIGNASATSFTMAHGLNTTDLVVSVKEIASGNMVMCDVKTVDAASILVSFATAPSTNQYRVTAIG